MIDKIILGIVNGLECVSDPRRNNSRYKLSNLLKIGYAMFHLKDSSLSSFKEQYSVRAENLERVYGITELPGDTALREGIDEVNPEELQNLFHPLLAFLKKEGVIKHRQVLGGYTVVSVDGTGHYCSGLKGCPQCLIKNHSNGKTTYHHQLLGAVAVHPEQSTVFPVACEAIVKQDGCTKNDCELNACKRIIPRIRKALGEENVLAVFDALYLNGPHIEALNAEKMSYIIGSKGETYVNVQLKQLSKAQAIQTTTWQLNGKNCTVNFANGLILNGQYQETLVNHFEYIETDSKSGEQTFYSTWVTDIEITAQNAQELVAVARSRWKIENETFNTLKNQGYNLEHNYGHGKKFLATNFAILTFLAFLTDQIAQHLDTDFQMAKAVCKTFKAFWEKIRTFFYLLPTMSMNAIYRFITLRKQISMNPLE